jgi:hypothetical protein
MRRKTTGPAPRSSNNERLAHLEATFIRIENQLERIANGTMMLGVIVEEIIFRWPKAKSKAARKRKR